MSNTDLKQIVVDLFSISILLFVNEQEQILYIDNYTQQPVQLIVERVFQVWHMIGCKKITVEIGIWEWQYPLRLPV